MAVFMSIAVSVITLIIVLWSWYQWRHRRLLSLARKLPSVLPTLPLLGHLHHALFKLDDVFQKVLFEKMMMKAAENGHKQFCFWAGPVPHIFIFSPEDVQTVLNSSKALNKGPEYDLLDFIIKDDVITAKENIWRPARRFLTSLFHSKNVELQTPRLNTQGRDFVLKISKQAGGKEFDILPILQRFAASNAIDLLAGDVIQIEDRSTLVNKMAIAIPLAFEVFIKRMVKYWLIFDLSILFKIIYRNTLKELDSLVTIGFEKPMKVFQETKYLCPSIKYQNGPAALTLLDLYFPAKEVNENLETKASLRDTFVTLSAAASDTSSIAISSCLMMLAMYPCYQEKVYQELKSAGLLDSSRDITPQDIRSLTYLDQFFKETMRLFTVLPLITRNIAEDLKLSFGTMPANSVVNIMLNGIHMSPDIYVEPRQFDPDHFADEKVRTRHKYSYLPFSGGPRNCIGKDYAIASMKTIIVHVLRNYKLKTTEKLKDFAYYYALDVRKINGYNISIEKRI